MIASERLQWIGLTVLGLLAGLALALPLGVPIFAVLGAMAGTPFVLGIVGLVLGGAQWPVVRRYMKLAGWWIVASTVGMAIGLTLGVITVEKIGRAAIGGPINFRMLSIRMRAASFGAIGLIGGTSLGLTQWFVLRRAVADCKRWIIANGLSLSLGLACGSLIADSLLASANGSIRVGLMLIIGGTVLGVVTSRMLPKLTAARNFQG